MAYANDLVQIFIADDHPVFRDALKTILTSDSQCRVIGEASDGEETLRMIPKDEPDILLMDLHMPVMDGCLAFGEIVRRCRDRNWEQPAVVFCTGFAPPDAVKDIVAGSPVHWLLAKPIMNDTLVDVVRKRLA